MAFGLSGQPSRSVMVGGDVVVAWLDRSTGQGYAHDYYLGAKAQCAGGRGACPDTKAVRSGIGVVQGFGSVKMYLLCAQIETKRPAATEMEDILGVFGYLEQ